MGTKYVGPKSTGTSLGQNRGDKSGTKVNEGKVCREKWDKVRRDKAFRNKICKDKIYWGIFKDIKYLGTKSVGTSARVKSVWTKGDVCRDKVWLERIGRN